MISTVTPSPYQSLCVIHIVYDTLFVPRLPESPRTWLLAADKKKERKNKTKIKIQKKNKIITTILKEIKKRNQTITLRHIININKKKPVSTLSALAEEDKFYMIKPSALRCSLLSYLFSGWSTATLKEEVLTASLLDKSSVSATRKLLLKNTRSETTT